MALVSRRGVLRREEREVEDDEGDVLRAREMEDEVKVTWAVLTRSTTVGRERGLLVAWRARH